MATSPIASAWQGGIVLVARVSTRRVGLPAERLSGVIPLPPLWRPPTLPRSVAGFVQLGRAPLAVLDMAPLLGLEPSPAHDLYAHVLLVRAAGRTSVGLLVDRAEEAVAIAAAALVPVDPGETLNGCAIAVADVDGAPVHLLAPERLLAARETAALAELSEQARRRLSEWGVAA